MLKYKPLINSSTSGDSTTVIDSTTIINTGNVYIRDITSSGIVSSKTYLPNTIPANSVLQSALTDTENVTIHFIAEASNLALSPIISVDSTVCTNLQQYSDDRRLFYGSVSINVPVSRTINIVSNSNKSTTVTVNRAPSAPTISSIEFIGGYPNGQTEVKQGDTLQVKVTFDSAGVEPTEIDVADFGISQAKTIVLSTTELNLGSVHTATFTISTKFVGNVATLLPIKLRAKNSFGTYNTFITSSDYGATENLYTMKGCDLAPTITVNATTYPASQSAFKDVEVGAINVTVTNYTDVVYSSPNNDFTIDTPSVYNSSKQITCNNTNTYNDSVNNIRVIATRSQNGKSTTSNFIVEVADIAPIVNVYHSEAGLRSTQAGYTYTIYAVSDQKLASAPQINIPVSGTWSGAGFTGSNKNWQRSIVITDANSKGTAALTFVTPATNKAGLEASITGNQIVQGFRSRVLTLASFGTQTTLNTAITNINNVTFTWSFKTVMAFSPIGTTPPVAGGWTIDSLNTNPTLIKILDTQAAASSSADSYITIEEQVY